jgi:predicted O-methyltransferase YrrM
LNLYLGQLTWKNKIVYHQADAFDVFKSIDKVDFVLIDGVKADYLEFLKECESKLSDSGMVLIDNSYWRGSFLDPEVSEKKQTAKNIKALHQYIKDSSKWEAVFVPFEDGVTLLRKTI